LKSEKDIKGKAAQTFEDLHIYQRARELTNQIYTITKTVEFSKDFALIDQIRHAAVSVMSNVAEGFERGSKIEFIQFLYIAKGSCGEIRAQLQIAKDLKYISDEKYIKLYKLAQMISAMISNFIAHLQTSNYQGEKVNRAKRLNLDKDKNKMNKFFAAHGVKLPNYDEEGN
jgi:four helix bundle protein